MICIECEEECEATFMCTKCRGRKCRECWLDGWEDRRGYCLMCYTIIAITKPESIKYK